MAVSNNVAVSNLAPVPGARANAATGTVEASAAAVFGGDSFDGKTLARVAGAGAGLGFMAMAFHSIRLLGGGGMLLSVPGMIVGAIGGARIVKWVQDNFQANVSVGSVFGAVALVAVYGMGGAMMAAASPGLAIPYAVGGTILAGVAGSTVFGLVNDGIVAGFRRLFKKD